MLTTKRQISLVAVTEPILQAQALSLAFHPSNWKYVTEFQRQGWRQESGPRLQKAFSERFLMASLFDPNGDKLKAVSQDI